MDTGMGEARALRAAAFVLGICCGVQWVGATKREEGKLPRALWGAASAAGGIIGGGARGNAGEHGIRLRRGHEARTPVHK